MANDENAMPADLRNLLPWDPSALSILPRGEWKPTARPIATEYVVPGRGSEGHGTDQDVKALDFKPDQSGGVAGMEEKYDPEHPDFKDLDAPQPLYVSVIPDPLKSVTKTSTTRLIIDGGVFYSSAAFSGVDPVNIVTFPRDESRTKLTLSVDPNRTVADASQAAQYVFAVSHNGSFASREYVLLTSTLAPYVFEGTEPLYVAIAPIAAYDATKQNSTVLNAIIETASSLDYNPSAG